ncbi:hypothetical protein HS088_TW17G00417 [Tripterygium wilfordii]|uniref:Uncharacterized protein n=2 Tax=Tripterygium wilfordii TaxID=458696 RepID=A0A7J7CFB7_TRIWF|nr:hypothetical protein HS088_TW17G00417 [Tripterygium wilfordii]
MADSIPHPKPIRSPTNAKAHSHNHFLFKALFFALFLLLLPMFPSEAPDFLNQTVFTKFWELLHLLFIGIAVSYGLFSRRVYNETNGDSQAFVSGDGFHVSSIFDNNPGGFDEKYAYYGGEYTIPVSSVVSQNGFDFSYGKGENDVTVQGWNSQYFQGESKVVVAQPNQGLDFQYKPLGLPVRNLRSRVNSPDSSSCSIMKSSSSNCSDRKIGNFGDRGSVNLDEKFQDTTIPMPSPIPWRSRSGRMEMRENLGALPSRPPHSRPQSVDETQFETLKTGSFRSTMPSYSSQSSSSVHSPNRVSPTHSTSSEEQSSGGEESVQDESPRHYSPLASQSPPMKGKAPLNSLHSSQKSYACFSENDVKEKLDYNYMDEARDGYLYGFEERGRILSNHSRHCSNGSSFEKELKRNFNNHSRHCSNGSSSEKELKRNFNNHSRHCSNGSSSEKELKRNFNNHSRHCSNGSSSEKELKKNFNNHSRHCSNGSSSEKEFERNFNNHSRPCSNGSSSEKELDRNFNNNFQHRSNESSSEKELERNFNDSLNNLGLQRKENSLNGIEMGMKSSNKKLQRSSNDEMRDLDEKKREYWLGRKEGRRIDSSKQEMKPENGVKASLKGKSVRTFRGSRYAKEAFEFGERFENEVNDNHQKRENQEVNEKVAEEPSKEKSIEKAENLGASSDEEAKATSNSTVNDAGPELDEVDKKAGEFIAKFREQIRLQKVASFRKSRGLHVNGNYFM